MTWRSWDDIEIGQTIRSQEVTVTETHLVNWASLTGDWFELHMSEEYARSTIFNQRVVHGPLTFGLSIGLAYQTGYVNKDWVIAWLGANDMKLPKPVFIGDTVHLDLSVVSKRETSNPDRGIAVLKYDIKNQNDDTVLEFESTFMARRASGGP
ncbi:MAG: hypothetical protein IH957_00620 [Chloroflexi bacterium]|nr:hypothetical protein [Chloroflexota bacterium]